MPGRMYTAIVTVGAITIYNVTIDPDGTLQATRGSLAVRSDAGNTAVYQNTDGALTWESLGLQFWSESATGDFLPATSDAQDVGSLTNRVRSTFSREVVAVRGTSVTPLVSPAPGTAMVNADLRGLGGSEGIQSAGAYFGYGSPAFVGGSVGALPGATAYMKASYGGGSLTGYILSGGDATMDVSIGGITAGAIRDYGIGATTVLGSAYSDYGSQTFGAIIADAGSHVIRSEGVGSMASGAIGDTFSPGDINGGEISALASGAHAFGFVAYSGQIVAGSYGSFASGHVTDQGQIRATGMGSHAVGSADAGFEILASASGSFAGGHALTSNIESTAAGAFQWGEGVNAVANSFQVGSGIRLLATGPGTSDGEMWRNGTNVYVRTGGITKNMTNIP